MSDANEVSDEVIGRLVCRALPIESPESLLTALAECWAAALDANSLFVSLFFRGQIHGVLLEDGRTESTRVPAPEDHWSTRLATDALSGLLEHGAEQLSSMIVVDFELDGTAVGGALILNDVQPPASVTSLAGTSARLISQLQKAGEPPHPDHDLRPDRCKLEALAEFAAGAGHEINNPVATIVGRASLLLKSETDPEKRRALETIGGQAHRIRDMIGDAMTFARPPEPFVETVCASDEVEHVFAQFESRCLAAGIPVERRVESDLLLQADREQFRVVLSCLIRNSLEAIDRTDDPGRISISCSSRGAKPGFVRLTVQDNGPGLNEIEREHLFDPFFSGRSAGRGLGFGLARCWQIVRKHEGEISVESEAAGGFTIHVDWPALS